MLRSFINIRRIILPQISKRNYPCYSYDPPYDDPKVEDEQNFNELMKIGNSLLKSKVVGSETKQRFEAYIKRNGTKVVPSYNIHEDYSNKICQLRSIFLNEYFQNKSFPHRNDLTKHIEPQRQHRFEDLNKLKEILDKERKEYVKYIHKCRATIMNLEEAIGRSDSKIATIDQSLNKVESLENRYREKAKTSIKCGVEDLEFLDSARLTTSLEDKLVVTDIRDELLALN